MRLVSWSLLFLSLLVAGAWFWVNREEVRSSLHDYVENGDHLTFEAQFSPERILALHKRDAPYSQCSQPELQFHPYLMFDVKFLNAQNHTQEGMLLWSLADGEMVLDTTTWEKTKGFHDCIVGGATEEDYRLLLSLSRYPEGRTTLRQLTHDTGLDEETLEKSIRSAEKKQLVIRQGNRVQLHFESPKLWVTPSTRIEQEFVTKSLPLTHRISRRFTRGQIQKAAQSAFGKGFAVRRAAEVFLPIYKVETYNPDGTVQLSYFNALNGQKI